MCLRKRGSKCLRLCSYFLQIHFVQPQCDQMARLFFNIWPFTSMKTFPNGKLNLPKSVQKIFPKIKNLPKIAQDFEDFAAVVKFRKNRSHWQPYLGKCMLESVMCKSEAEHETVCVRERESSILTLCLLSI